ncbi:MAG: hypothetical protein ABR881_26470 [Candidatus Sulfotelmatobacter sp.]
MPVASSSPFAAIATVANATVAKRVDKKPGDNSYARPTDVTNGPMPADDCIGRASAVIACEGPLPA